MQKKVGIIYENNTVRNSRNWSKTAFTTTVDKGVVEELNRLIPKGQRSEYVNRLLRENLFSPLEYAHLMKRSHAQQMNYWDSEVKRLETEVELKREMQRSLDFQGWDK